MIESKPVYLARAKASFTAAITSIYNLYVIIACLAAIGGAVWFYFQVGVNLIVIIILPIMTLFLFFYFRAIMTRELAVSDQGIHFNQKGLNALYEWDRIERVKVDDWRKRLFLKIEGKVQEAELYVHGLEKRPYQEVMRVMAMEMEKRGIELVKD